MGLNQRRGVGGREKEEREREREGEREIERGQKVLGPGPGSSVGESVVLIGQGCGFSLWSGHIQESTGEYLSWLDNKLISLSKNQ